MERRTARRTKTPEVEFHDLIGVEPRKCEFAIEDYLREKQLPFKKGQWPRQLVSFSLLQIPPRVFHELVLPEITRLAWKYSWCFRYRTTAPRDGECTVHMYFGREGTEQQEEEYVRVVTVDALLARGVV